VIRFALEMAARETRGGWRHVLTVLVCVALGVASLVSVGSLAVELERTLAREAKTLLGGDVEVRATRAVPAAVVDAVARLHGSGAALVHTRELVGMARSGAGVSLLVEVKAVDGGYPLYGAVTTRPAAALTQLLAGDGAVVEEALLSRLSLTIGDRLILGDVALVVRGVLVSEPDRPASLVSLGPRVLIDQATLEGSGLVTFGSRVRHRWLFRLPASLTPAEARATLAAAIEDPSIRIAAFDEAQPGLKRFLDELGTYLGLIGLVSLLVGGVGVAASVTTFMRRRRPTVAVLKCLGADGRMLLVTYVAQTGLVGLAGSLVGAALGVTLLPALVALTRGVVPFAISGRADPITIVRGVTMGVAITLLCALWPLLRIRDVRPVEVLRQDVAPVGRGRGAWRVAASVAAGLTALAIWQAGSWKVGGIFVGAALGALVLLAALGRAVVLLARVLPRRGALAWRQGVAGLLRPGGQVAGIVVALGAGVMLLEAVALLEGSLDAQLDHERRREAPSFFFIDVQTDQRVGFDRLVRETTGVTPRLVPVVRARLAAIGGEPITRALVDRRRAERKGDEPFFLVREYMLTAADVLPEGNAVVAGRWWAPDEQRTRPHVSLEEDMAKKLNVGVGGTVAFDVQGVRVDAEVTSIRHVDWQSFTTNFFAILSPGALDGAPTTWVATARVPAAIESQLQDRVVAAFPNVTAVPVRDVLERVSGLLGQMAFAIRGIAGFSIGAGLVVMIAALAASRAQRLYESVILRTLGATRAVVARAFAVEYACLGAAAGLGGTALAAMLAWIVLNVLMEVPTRFAPLTLVAGVVLTVALSIAVGFLTTWRLLGQKPLPVLRRE
jgi:putative ABC transport system permease protein